MTIKQALIHFVLLIGTAQAQTQMQPILLPGIGPHDPRHAIDLSRMPWRALGRVQSGGDAGRCTGALIAPNLVLTAAHCLWSRRVRHMIAPQDLHFLLRYDKDQWAAHATGKHFLIGPGYDPQQRDATESADWAIVTLAGNIGGQGDTLPLADRMPAPGDAAMLAGYGQDRAEEPLADTSCAVVGIVAAPRGGSGPSPLLRHSCTGTSGTSGGPLLVHQGTGWAISGVQVMAERGIGGGWATIPAPARFSQAAQPGQH